MNPIRRILAPTDLSELSWTGIHYAVDLAEALQADVIIYHVVDYDTLTLHGQRSGAQPHFSRLTSYFWSDISSRYRNFSKIISRILIRRWQCGQRLNWAHPIKALWILQSPKRAI
jgi:hypothetical protein